MNGNNYTSESSTGYTSSQALKDHTRQKTEAIFADRPRDIPLLVGFTEGEQLLADMGFATTGDARADDAIGAVCCSAVIASCMGRGVSFSLHGAFYSGKQRRYQVVSRSVV